MALFVGHDLGTSGDKAVLVDASGAILATHTAPFGLSHPGPGRAEQDPDDWWAAVCEGTRAVAAGREDEVAGVAFAGQMLSLVSLNAAGRHVRPAVVWMDHRAEAEAARLTRRLGGASIVRAIAGAAPTGKDLLPKMAWLAAREPATWRQTRWLGDATSALVARATGRVGLDPTAAGATGVFDATSRRWTPLLARLAGLPLDRMPPVARSIDVAGPLLPDAATELGLRPGTPVAVGLADIPAAAIGSGAVLPGDAHAYLGTSSWVAVTLSRPRHAPRAGIVSVASADPGRCLMIAESETAGACRDWLHGLLAGADLDALAAQAPPGSDGLLFCPWLFGERSPYPDSAVRGAFVGLSLGHGPAHLARAVLEGVAVNLRWTLRAIDGAGTPRSRGLRAIGGGAASDLWMQLLADATEEPVARLAAPRFAGAVGAALVAAVAVGAVPSIADVRDRVHIDRTFQPGDPSPYRAAERRMRALAPALSRDARRR